MAGSLDAAREQDDLDDGEVRIYVENGGASITLRQKRPCGDRGRSLYQRRNVCAACKLRGDRNGAEDPKRRLYRRRHRRGTALTVEDVELTERGDGVMALRVLLTADGESAALEMTVRGA